MVSGNVVEARQLLGIALDDRIGFETAATGYTLRIPIAFDRLITAAVPELRGLQVSFLRDR